MPFENYPKWVGNSLVHSVEEEAEALGVPVDQVVIPEPPPADVPPGYIAREFPKWVLGQIVDDEAQEAALWAAEASRAEIALEAEMRDEEAPKRRGRPPKVDAQ